jgi:hypothetical protein
MGFSFKAKAIVIQNASKKYRVSVPPHDRFNNFDYGGAVIVESRRADAVRLGSRRE